MLEIKNSVTEMKNAIDGPEGLNRLDETMVLILSLKMNLQKYQNWEAKNKE